MKFDPKTGEFIPDEKPQKSKSRKRRRAPAPSQAPERAVPQMEPCPICEELVPVNSPYCNHCGVELIWDSEDSFDHQELDEPAYPGEGGCMDRVLNFLAIPFCLFVFPVLGWFMLTDADKTHQQIVGGGLLIAAAYFWAMLIYDVLKKIWRAIKRD